MIPRGGQLLGQVVGYLIEALADYEHLDPPSPEARQRLSEDAMSNPPRYWGLIAEHEGQAVGYAMYFYTYSSFLARPTLYIEDIFVLPDKRRLGIGDAIMKTLARQAKAEGCGRMEWVVLDWNVTAQAFYQRCGAYHLDNWQTYRLTEDKIALLAE
jgi:GNAT superfamily N-acetyltransferase